MSHPTYHNVTLEEIKEINLDGGKLRLLAGQYKDYEGYQGDYVKINFYDIELDEGKSLTLETRPEESVMVFTLLGDAKIAGEAVDENTAVKLGEGETVVLEGGDGGSKFLFFAARPLNEPKAWAGPIVMNTYDELQKAFKELEDGTFIKENINK